MVKLYHCSMERTYQGWFGVKTDSRSAYFVFPVSLSHEECLYECGHKAKKMFYNATKYNGYTMKTELVEVTEGQGFAIWVSHSNN